MLCWGENIAGQLGDGTLDDRYAPVKVNLLSEDATAIAAGYTHTCALTAGGDVVCWGDNWAGQLGNQPNQYSGSGGKGVGYTAVMAGGAQTCALTFSGGAQCWGENIAGGLGDGTTENRSAPVDVIGLSADVRALAAGVSFSCAIHSGRAVCWGLNDSGQLGIGSFTNSLVPLEVTGLGSNVVGVTAGVSHACAVTDKGEVWCWGDNGMRQLGQETMMNSQTPLKVGGLEGGVIAVVAGGSHTCALTKAGGVKCWGDNSHGQLGDGTTVGRSTPADVAGLTSGVIAVAAGASHTCAMLTGGAVKCWGANGNGQLGDGTNVDRNAPVAVAG